MHRFSYSVPCDQNIASPDDTLVTITGSATARPVIYEFTLGSGDTPADTAVQWYMQRTTAAGTGTAVTPAPHDTADRAAVAAAADNHTAEPTYTAGAFPWQMPLNLRASHHYQADADGGFIVPATANNGIGIYPTHASSTAGVIGCVMFFE